MKCKIGKTLVGQGAFVARDGARDRVALVMDDERQQVMMTIQCITARVVAEKAEFEGHGGFTG